MASKSKEDDVLKILLENSPLKEWHFEEVVNVAKVSKAVANKWLKKFVRGGLIKRIKRKGEFPFFTVGSNNPVYYSLKKIYALEQLHKSGLLPKLESLTSVKTIILFGSMIKGDWYKNSDVDMFVLGNIPDFNKNTYECRLNRNIELHVFENKKEIKKMKTGLIKNIINGYVVKGQIQDIINIK
ncbi:MAG: nucleotidyltransferase domain-containing protein [Nanoarchaeota archaeon]|nr:nucleotidyltransferase domain-containing protein [Nanoarchaeota archaeon]